jgi:hypothetical protein
MLLLNPRIPLPHRVCCLQVPPSPCYGYRISNTCIMQFWLQAPMGQRTQVPLAGLIVQTDMRARGTDMRTRVAQWNKYIPPVA